MYYDRQEKQGNEPCRGVEVFVWNNSDFGVVKAIKTFSRLVKKEGVIRDYEAHEYFASKSEKRRRQRRLGAKRVKSLEQTERYQFDDPGQYTEVFKNIDRLRAEKEKNYVDDYSGPYSEVFKNIDRLKAEKESADRQILVQENLVDFGEKIIETIDAAINAVADKKVVSVTIVAETTDDKLLLLKAKNKFRIGFPGGGVNYKENIYAAADREFKEETGLIINNLDKNLFCYIPLRDNYNPSRTVYMTGVYVRLPWTSEKAEEMLIPGDEVERNEYGNYLIDFFSREEIEDMIACKEFLPKHAEIFENLA